MPEQNKPALLRLPKHIREIISAPIPETLIKERDGGGGKKLSYISGSTVIDMLNASFGYMWNWEVIKEWVQDSQPYFNSYSKLPDDQKVTVNGKRGAWEDQLPVAHVHGRLHVFFYDENGNERRIMKDGFGSKSVLGKQNDQESIFKAAGTDALKKAASLIGVGAELYRDEDEQLFFDMLNYEDPWTEEMKAKYEPERAYLVETMEEYGLNVDDMGTYVAEFSEDVLTSLDQIVPDNIQEFVEFLQAKIAAATQQEKVEEKPEKPKSPLSK